LTLVYKEQCGNHSDALRRELQIKALARDKKEMLIKEYSK